MNKKLYTRQLVKTATSLALFSSVLVTSAGLQAAQSDIAQVPLSVAEGVPPNMIFTLDESGSMSWAFVPDMTTAAGSVYVNKIGGGSNYNTRRMRAAATNPMAYNPNVIYQIPPTFDVSGAEIALSTSFTDAPLNGFWLSSDWSNTNGRIMRDLSQNYMLAHTHRQGSPSAANGGTLSWASHPADEFKAQTFSVPSNGTYEFPATDERILKYEISRSRNSCVGKVFLGPSGSDVRSFTCSLDRSNNATTPSYTGVGVPAYYYEFEPSYKRTDSRVASLCSEFEDASGKGEKAFSQSESCYRLVWVAEDTAYNTKYSDPNRNRLKHPDGTLVDGRENFAIWYSFYRSRALATLSAAKIAFYNLSPDVRFTWQDLATCRSFESSGGAACGNNKLKPYTAQHRGEFYTWLRKRHFNVSTPLPAAMKRAGEYLRTETPWQKYLTGDDENNKENTYACRPSYHVLMTDGLWNTRREASHNISTGRHDYNSTISFPSTNDAGLPPPYGDTASNTLADLAYHYWNTDLQPGLSNKVPKYIRHKSSDAEEEYWDPRNNPADWQHMTNFIMGLGLTTILNEESIPWEGSTFSGVGYDNLKTGAASWPVAGTSVDDGRNATGNEANVYDLWHAAINSRGEFFSVDTPEDMVQAFKDILTRIADRKSSAAMPGIGMVSDDEGENPLEFSFYQTGYDSAAGWTGNMTKVVKTRVWDPLDKVFKDQVAEAWSASVPTHGNRNIKMAAAAGGLIDFKEGQMASSATYEGENLEHWLGINPEPSKQHNTYTAADRLNYLRGSNAHASEEEKSMRVRSSLLGDFISSQPALVSNQTRYLEGMANKLEENTSYTTFRTSISERKSLVYVGANDGMLHAFDVDDGKEVFAFVPTPVFPYLNQLTGKGYSHRFYVDGSPVISDVYDGEKWRTILVGTLRAGGKGLFALDITDPANITLLWELHEYNIPSKDKAGSSVNVKPGYSFSKPTVARLHNGRWAVVTGNGYKGDGTNNGKAALYIVDAITGDLTKTLEVEGGLGENGLSTPRLADFDGDGVADYAYAGDLQGNLWRFDLLGDNAAAGRDEDEGSIYGDKAGSTAGFKVSYGGKAMFKAKATTGNHAQAITSAPSIARHPTRKGYLVSFGTGRYVEIGDKSAETSHAQTVYGIWDKKTKAEATTELTGFPISFSSLHKQEFESVTTGEGVVSGVERTAKTLKRQTGNERLNWDNKNGWYLDLAVAKNYQGEMMIEDMRVLGNVLIFQTLIPNSDPCSNGASNWLYALDIRTGGVTDHHVFDTRANTLVVSGIEFGAEGGVSISQDEDGYRANAPGDVEPITPDPSSLGRQSWRFIQNP